MEQGYYKDGIVYLGFSHDEPLGENDAVLEFHQGHYAETPIPDFEGNVKFIFTGMIKYYKGCFARVARVMQEYVPIDLL